MFRLACAAAVVLTASSASAQSSVYEGTETGYALSLMLYRMASDCSAKNSYFTTADMEKLAAWGRRTAEIAGISQERRDEAWTAISKARADSSPAECQKMRSQAEAKLGINFDAVTAPF